jgi:hypothetical protein
MGPKVLGELPGRNEIPPQDVEKHLKQDSLLVDTHPPAVFGASHIGRAFNIGLSPQLSSWAARVVFYGNPILLLLESNDLLPEVAR